VNDKMIIDPMKTVDAAAAPEAKQAEDWIAKFSKQSEEALAKKAAEKNLSPPPNEEALINQLARKDQAEYDKVRADIAETLGIRKITLDEKVDARREELKTEAIGEPAHWSVTPELEAVDGAELLDQLRGVFRRYIVMPPGADIALALWALHAWTHDASEISPIACLTSPTKRCGKTNVLILLQFLTPRSELAANVTAASIFRYVEAVRPTLLIDEADSFLGDNDELRGILNSGHTKAGASVIRVVEEGGEQVVKRFSTWAPKAIALIKKLPDTLADRSIIVHLMRKPRTAVVERLRKRDSDEFRLLRSRAARWAEDHTARLVDLDPAVPETLHDRAADNWRPLLAIADLAGGSWPQLARQAACQLTGMEQDGAVNVTLLGDLKAAFGDAEVMRSSDLVAKLTADPESPWSEYNRGKPLTQRGLARLLADFHIITEEVHPPGLSHGKGYKRVWFEELWATFNSSDPGQDPSFSISPPPQARKRANADGSRLTSDFSSAHEEVSARFKNDDLSYSHAGLRTCADEKGGTSESEARAAPEGVESAPNGVEGDLPSCAHCGLAHPAPNQVSIDGNSLWLHRGCEAAWTDLEIPTFLRRANA
jgi:putative DNA primase/helicase